MKSLVFLLIFAGPILAAEGPRILIVTDFEGVGGVSDADEQLLPGQRRYDETCRLLTGEVNSAVEGALDAGASEIVIWDGHDGSRSLSIDAIHPKAQLIQGKPTPANFYLSERRYDGIIFIGQHAMAGTKDGILAHSQSFSVQGIYLNGKPVGETGQVAAIAGYFDIPVIMLSGDEAACREMLALQPKAETVAVKRLAGKASSLSLSQVEACARIRAAAGRAVGRARDFAPWKVEGTVELKFEYYPEAPGTPASELTHPDRSVAAKTVVYRGNTVLEAYEAWLGK